MIVGCLTARSAREEIWAVEAAMCQFSAWLEVLNRGDRDRYPQFLTASFPSRLDSLDRAMVVRERTAGLTSASWSECRLPRPPP